MNPWHIHCSNGDDGSAHVRYTRGDRWIEIEHVDDGRGALSRGWSWTTSDGEVCEDRSAGEATAAVRAFVARST